MKCQDAEKWILLEDSGELSEKQNNELAGHLQRCSACQELQDTLIGAQDVFQIMEEPSAVAVQNVLREARLNAPRKKPLPIFGLKPAIAMAASAMIGLGIFFSVFHPDKVGMEFVVTETQLLSSEDQVVSVMYNGLSEDDLAFNFLMTYDGI